MTPLEIITIRAPDFAAEPNVNSYIGLATGKVCNCYGANVNEAIALLTMHMMALDSRSSGDAVGNLKSEKEGDLAKTFGKSNTGDMPFYYTQTNWGVEYWQTVNSSFVLPRNRFTNGC